MTKVKDDATPSVRQYLEIKSQYQEYLIFYRMGDFYEMFFEDAIIASKAVDLVLTKRGTYQGKEIPMCGVPYHAYESYLSRLIKQGHKVAICEQTETPEEARKRGGYKAVVNREVVRLVTSGTLTEDVLLDAKKNNYLLACVPDEKSFAFSWADLSTGEFYTREIEFGTNKKCNILQMFLTNIDAGEIIVADNIMEDSSLFDVLTSYMDKLTVLPKAKFSFVTAQNSTENFFGVQTLDSFGSFTKNEIIAMGVVLDYIENTQKGNRPSIKTPQKCTQNQFMEIDAATRISLELINSNNKKASLLGAIDRTVTGNGARLLANRIVNPILDINLINQRLDWVSFFIKTPQLRKNIQECLKTTADLERIISRLSLNKCEPREIVSLGSTLLRVPKIRNLIYNIEQYNLSFEQIPQDLDDRLQNMADFSSLVTEIGEALKDEEILPKFAHDGGFIKNGYNASLDHLRNIQANQIADIAKLEKKYIEETHIPNLKIKHTGVLGYFVEVPAKMATDMIQMPQFIHRQSVLNAARFTTVELNEMEHELLGASDKALALELDLYNAIISKILCVSKEIYDVAKVFAELDVAVSFADLAVEKNYCRPIVDNSQDFIVKDGRHPVVEYAIEKEMNGTFVGNNCNLSATDDRIWLITGPNMAGKSTFLRQNCIIALMAHIGAYVPCSYAKIGVIDKMFSRVGASDDLSRGRSTFMVEMVETAAILNQATERSFVILDEIGRGTATYDGLSIAWSVIEHLYEVNKCRALFATHYHELTVLAAKLQAMSLHCMKIKEFKGDVIFLHEVINGTADRSYGIHVAKLAGIPKLAISRAEQILKSLEKNSASKGIVDVENDLPLFAVLKKEHEEVQEKVSPIQEFLNNINPDNMSPREALDKLYELKKLSEN